MGISAFSSSSSGVYEIMNHSASSFTLNYKILNTEFIL